MKYKWKRQTAIFLTSQGISLFGSALVQFSLTSYITMQTKSGVMATIAILCAILPTFFLSPFAGVWADKYDRKFLTIIADGGIALCTLIMVIFFSTGNGSISIIMIALIVRALGAAVQTPAVSALLPDIVPEDQLTRVNGINGTLQSISMLLSPVLGAALMGIATLEVIFWIDIITAVIAIVILIFAFKLPKKEEVKKPETTGNYFGEMAEGLKYIRENKFLIEFFCFLIAYFILIAPPAFLSQIQVLRNYGDSYKLLAILDVSFSAGMIVGGIAISVWQGLKNKVHTMIAAGVLIGVTVIPLGFHIPFMWYCFFTALCGLGLPFLNTPATTLLQEKVDPAYMGRIFGIMTMINTSMMPLGMVIFGPLADKVSVEVLMLASGIACIVIAFAMSRAKTLVKAGA